MVVNLNKKSIGNTFKNASKTINEIIDSWEEEDKLKMMKEFEEKGEIILKVNDKELKLSMEFITFETQEKMVQEEKYTPSVIEPSFGIGRVVYCIFEHCFKVRPDNA